MDRVQKLTVRVVKAQLVDEAEGSYVVLSYHGKTKQTKGVPKSLNPIWNEDFQFSFNQEVNELHIEVLDHGEKFVGKAKVSLDGQEPGRGRARWYDLRNRKGKKDDDRGRVRLRILIHGDDDTLSDSEAFRPSGRRQPEDYNDAGQDREDYWDDPSNRHRRRYDEDYRGEERAPERVEPRASETTGRRKDRRKKDAWRDKEREERAREAKRRLKSMARHAEERARKDERISSERRRDKARTDKTPTTSKTRTDKTRTTTKTRTNKARTDKRKTQKNRSPRRRRETSYSSSYSSSYSDIIYQLNASFPFAVAPQMSPPPPPVFYAAASSTPRSPAVPYAVDGASPAVFLPPSSPMPPPSPYAQTYSPNASLALGGYSSPRASLALQGGLGGGGGLAGLGLGNVGSPGAYNDSYRPRPFGAGRLSISGGLNRSFGERMDDRIETRIRRSQPLDDYYRSPRSLDRDGHLSPRRNIRDYV